VFTHLFRGDELGTECVELFVSKAVGLGVRRYTQNRENGLGNVRNGNQIRHRSYVYRQSKLPARQQRRESLTEGNVLHSNGARHRK